MSYQNHVPTGAVSIPGSSNNKNSKETMAGGREDCCTCYSESLQTASDGRHFFSGHNSNIVK